MRAPDNETKVACRKMNREVKIRFEEDPEANCIEICIRALKRDQGIDELIASISAALPEMITATGADGAFIKISTADIVSVSVNGKYLQIVTEKDRYIVRQSLHDFEEKLDAKNFVRISRYEIVNIGKIKKYDRLFSVKISKPVSICKCFLYKTKIISSHKISTIFAI